jgi:2-ketocyclohexanecarboxyl-CoA hydrolase
VKRSVSVTIEPTGDAKVKYNDILFQTLDGVATITINRPDVHNAFRAETCEELLDAFKQAACDDAIGVIVLTGAGDKAFCTGGDLSAHEGQYSGRGTLGLPLEELQAVIRDVSKPVIARVQGYAIGGGNVLALLCDLTIASESAVFGQVGPKVGSVDPGFGTAYMARVIGEKRAREVWFLCRQYSGADAVRMGLANAVVPDEELDSEVQRWCQEILDKSPTALAIAKRSFNADTAHIAGLSHMGMQTVKLFYGTQESKEGVRAFKEKRRPDFEKYRE